VNRLSSSPVPRRAASGSRHTRTRAESRTHATRLVLPRSLRDARKNPPGYGEGTRVRAVRVHPRRRKPGPTEVGTASAHPPSALESAEGHLPRAVPSSGRARARGPRPRYPNSAHRVPPLYPTAQT